ncbi:MAG: hypothetical protein LIO46_07635 [Clostridiales bacterium]|nr:hypothetical protein [Clostridiales bacterium]
MRGVWNMLRGVNRQVLEISQTDHEYFERVLFFVKPEYYNLDESKLHAAAEQYAQDGSRPPRTRKSGSWHYLNYAKFAGAAAAGAGLMALFSYLNG